ncbi:MAG TPA: hypothetical protein VIL65_04405 [Beijerinckiaceae bacterium]
MQSPDTQNLGDPPVVPDAAEPRDERDLPGGSIADTLTGKDLYHGNYCGHGSKGTGLPAADDLDAACQRHDACYDQAGYRSCACDAKLRDEVLALAGRRNLSEVMRSRAETIAAAADLMECRKP